MKFKYRQPCDCGGEYLFKAYGDERFEPVRCSKCRKSGVCFDPLSVSNSAERLLYRGKYEFEDGDYSISILTSVMAVEYFLTALHQKIKELEFYGLNTSFPPRGILEIWTKDKDLQGKSTEKLDRLCHKCASKNFNKYVQDQALLKMFSNAASDDLTGYLQQELFERRNRIVHRGFVNSSADDAKICLDIATSVISILRHIDNEYFKRYI